MDRGEMENKKVRLKDVAQRLGVSTVTVSNALSGKKGVSRMMRDRIEQTAREMGLDLDRYEDKNSRQINICAILTEQANPSENSFCQDLYRKAEQAALTGNALLTQKMVSEGDISEITADDSLEGLLIIGKISDSLLDRIMEAAPVPVVLLNFSRPGIPCVLPNNYAGMYRAAQYGVDMGHKKLGFVGTTEISGNIRERYFGFRRCLAINHLPLHREWVVDNRDLDEKFFLHTADTPPDLLVCASDAIAVSVYEALDQRGISIPADVSVVSFGNFLPDHPFGLRLTTYNVDRERMAKRAVELLLSQIDGKDPHTDPVYIDSVMIERSSVKDMR